MNEIQFRAIGPIIFDVVDMELAICGNPRRLNWAEVGASDNTRR
jgi:hypothetical protein